VRAVDNGGRCVNSQAACFAKYFAEYVVFAPRVGSVLEGLLHVALVCVCFAVILVGKCRK
jgi:hypothetical protein